MYVYICIYIYIYIYTGAVLSPTLTVDHPAIYKTSWRVGETIELSHS